MGLTSISASLAAALLAGGDVQDAVGVDEELDLDAGQAGDHGRDAFEVEAGERAAVFGEFALALEDVDGDVGLAVDAGGEVLGGGGGDGGVALDDFGDDAAEGFDAERERGDVEQQEIVWWRCDRAGEDLAWTAAPRATTSSGLSSVWGFLPRASSSKSSSTSARTAGMRVEPPTMTTSSICSGRDAGVFERLLDRGRRCGR